MRCFANLFLVMAVMLILAVLVVQYVALHISGVFDELLQVIAKML